MPKDKIRFYILTVLSILLLLAGTYFRYKNIWNYGFYFDMVETQYVWAKNASEMGLIDYWRDYNGFFDYLPGALYLITFIKWISNLIGGDVDAFVFILKLTTWVFELLFFSFIYFLALKHGKFKNKQVIIFLISLFYFSPAFWFVGQVWGQFDTIHVSILVLASYLLYFKPKEKNIPLYKNIFFWSGFLYAAAFWIKMQAILILPVIIFFHYSHRNIKSAFQYSVGFISSTILITIMPLLVNSERLFDNLAAPFTREDRISNGAASFWEAISKTGSAKQPALELGGLQILVEIAGILLFFSFISILVIRYYFPRFKNLMSSIKKPENLSLQNFMIFATLIPAFYYMLFTKMHSRYLHIGLLFGIIAFFIIKTLTFYKYLWLALVIIMNISYGINQAFVFVVAQNNPEKWVVDFVSKFDFNLNIFAGILNTITLLGLYFLAFKILKEPVLKAQSAA